MARNPLATLLMSGTEYYTPVELIARVHATMGAIDLDPCSSVSADRVVCSRLFYTKQLDGLGRLWRGRVFLHPPCGYVDKNGNTWLQACELTGSCGIRPPHLHEGKRRSAVSVWHKKLATEYEAGNVTEAIVLVADIEVLRHSPLIRARHVNAVCVFAKRLQFLNEALKPQVPAESASAAFYLGARVHRFIDAFRDSGTILVPWKSPVKS